MSEIQKLQNQAILQYAEENFNMRTHEYGRQDMAGQPSSKRTNNKIDPSRLNQDLDGDGRKGVDCSSLVYYALKGAHFDLNKSADDFTTRTLFIGDKTTNYARQNFDVLPSSSKTDGSLQTGDILMLRMPGGAQHVAIFKEYDSQGRIHFFGAQTSTGPAEVIMTGNKYWDKDTKYLGALRPKEDFILPEFRQKPASPAEDLSSLIQGLMNDKDGSFGKQALAENPHVIEAFDEKLRYKQMQEVTAANTQQEALHEERSVVGRSFG